jgi:hypothetical protein
MYWKIYYILNCILLALVSLIVLLIETSVVEKLSVIAGAISVLGLYSYVYQGFSLSRWFGCWDYSIY